MAFRLHPGRAVGAEVRRVIRQQLAAAIAAARAKPLPAAERAHRARVAVKRARAALALIRATENANGKRETRWLRQAARDLGPIREASVLLETLNALQEQWGDKVDSRTLSPLRQRLLARVREARAAADARTSHSLERFATRVHRVDKRMAALELDGDGFDLIAAGVEKTYRRARRAFRRAGQDGSTPTFHRWRKHTKAHAYQFELLQLAWPEVMANWRRKLQILGRLLGDEHDLALLQEWLARDWRDKADRHNVRALLELIASRRTELREDALDLGRRAFAEKPAALNRRLTAWWGAAADTARDERT